MSDAISFCIRALQLLHENDWQDSETSHSLQGIYAHLFGADAADEAANANHSPKAYEESLRWMDRLIVAFDEASLPPDAWWPHVRGIDDAIIRMHLILEMMRRLVATGDHDRARFYLEQLPELSLPRGLLIAATTETTRHRGHRIFLDHFAERGDVKCFETQLPDCEPKKARHEIGRARSVLIRKVSAEKGWKTALQLSRRKGFGAAYAFDALAPLADSMSVRALQKIFRDYPDLGGPPLYTRERVLVAAFRKDRDARTIFAELLADVMAIAPKTKLGGDYALRDWLICEIGSACADVDDARHCQKQMKSAALKRELAYHIKRLEI